ncbi:kinase-like protein [Coniophora puteana RWD-64-598 SS2]|uniref:Kinase-like protein n=1 Tax=Coniophora puteana (strain RWD-64-598) TaxID=741705 RepID=A0A5M3N528_CONPW|nr:kinase-like protein [Coniophora puteana RWD-64-598 SS2]EIW86406.1 kinase-like protein [Coniophora puteana RWD-64-598 SS2]
MSSSVSKRFIGAVQDEWQLFSDCSSDYTMGAPIGFGASSIVYAAIFNPPEASNPVPCALKVLDLDSLSLHTFSLLRRETQLMSLSKHPNVLRVRGSWMDGHKLYIALRLMNKGSAADVMRYGWPGGMEEEVVKCILKQALEGLNYLHVNGFIHRDVKAANLLIDDDGTVLLGDLGVSTSLSDDHDTSRASGGTDNRAMHFEPLSANKAPHLSSPQRPKMGKRKSFVGTPCWMAPELIQGKQYDSKADIWSFAITAIELTQGRPPRSRDSPHSVLLNTVQGKPPTLDREHGVHQYSRAFKDIVDSCLKKDPSLRPTAEQLLQTPFFKSAKKKSYLVNAILNDLPPLTMRQERRRREGSVMSHGTTDSWDFNVTAAGSPVASIIGASTLSGKALQRLSKVTSVHSAKSTDGLIVSKARSNTDSVGGEQRSRYRGSNGNQEDGIGAGLPSRSKPRAVPGRNPSTTVARKVEDVVNTDEFIGSHLPTLPPLSSSPTDSSESSAASAVFHSSNSSLSAIEAGLPSPLPDHPLTQPTTIPIRSGSFSWRRKPSFASAMSTSPSSLPSAGTTGFWKKLTRSNTRTLVAEEDKPPSGLARMLSKHGVDLR